MGSIRIMPGMSQKWGLIRCFTYEGYIESK